MEKEGLVNETENYTLNLLTENSVALQKILAEVATNLKELNGKLNKLLGLFEEAARTFKEKKPESIDEREREILNRLNDINSQNRTIARGVMLLEQSVRNEDEEAEPQPTTLKPKPLPEFKL